MAFYRENIKEPFDNFEGRKGWRDARLEGREGGRLGREGGRARGREDGREHQV